MTGDSVSPTPPSPVDLQALLGTADGEVVEERDGVLVLAHDRRRDLARHDAAEQARRHRQAPRGPAAAGRGGSPRDMTASDGADRVGHGEASLGDAQAANPPDDPEMIFDDADERDTDVEFDGEAAEPPEERDNEDPAPNAP